MTPSAFAKMGLRLLALYMGLFVALPGLFYAAEWALASVGAESMGYVLWAGITVALAVWLWMAADRILDMLLPISVAREIPADYPRLQGLVLMFMGGLLAFDGLYWLLDVILMKDLTNLARGVIYSATGLALFCEPVWRRRH